MTKKKHSKQVKKKPKQNEEEIPTAVTITDAEIARRIRLREAEEAAVYYSPRFDLENADPCRGPAPTAAEYLGYGEGESHED
jgi:hypothetical protein